MLTYQDCWKSQDTYPPLLSIMQSSKRKLPLSFTEPLLDSCSSDWQQLLASSTNPFENIGENNISLLDFNIKNNEAAS